MYSSLIKYSFERKRKIKRIDSIIRLLYIYIYQYVLMKNEMMNYLRFNTIELGTEFNSTVRGSQPSIPKGDDWNLEAAKGNPNGILY